MKTNYSKMTKRQLIDELEQMDKLFDLQHSRTAVADKLWQEAHNKPHTLPDLGKLIEWLLQRAK